MYLKLNSLKEILNITLHSSPQACRRVSVQFLGRTNTHFHVTLTAVAPVMSSVCWPEVTFAVEMKGELPLSNV